MTRRLLLVEPSTTMRHELELHLRALGHEVEATASYAEAMGALERRYRVFTADIAGVLFGWPALPEESADALAARLESVDFHDLPVLVLSTDLRAETRAWAAGRVRTAVLGWKDYLGVEALLDALLEEEPEIGESGETERGEGELHVLVVDDSAAIRYSLRDLLETQGYRVSVAASGEEALARARRTRVDIAVLDFYLGETTGDAVCRELLADPTCGEIVCAVLTGTYAEPVIKRSLRAGALECMFKNESSELLLTRLEAIGRLVRRRRELAESLALVGRAFDTMAGAVLLVDEDERVRHASPSALAELGHGAFGSLAGRRASELLGIEALPPADAGTRSMRWRAATGASAAYSVTRRSLPGGEQSLLAFERADGERARAPARAAGHDSLHGLGLPSSSVPFVERLDRYAARRDSAPERVSLLVLGVFERRDDGSHRAIAPDSELAARVAEGLAGLYRHEHHVAALGGHRHGLLLRHLDAPRSYLLTRRLMQLVGGMLEAQGGPALASVGCLVGLEHHVGASAETLLERALHGLGIAAARGVDQVLLLDTRQMLMVHPQADAAGRRSEAGAVSPPVPTGDV